MTRRPVWVEIDLDALDSNMEKIRAHVKKGVLITAMVKADAYGHGAVTVARELLQHGADRLAVAMLDEAVELRQAGITARILIVGPTGGERAEELVLYGIDPCVFHYDDAKAFSDEAVKQNRIVNIHIGIDSGMGRIGYRPTEEAIAEIKKISQLPNIVIDGMFTHFAISDVKDKTFTRGQFKKFKWVSDRLEEEGVHVNIHHCANSAACVEMPEYHWDMVRPGIILYGYAPSKDVDSSFLGLKQVMSLKCRITHLKQIEAGDSVSYGRKFIADGPRTIASIAVGYADGYPRLLSNQAPALVHGQRVKQVGRICMDQCMIDVTGVPDVKINDEVCLYGYQDGAYLPLLELADIIGTITNDMVCMINRRVARVYTRGGKEVSRVEYLQQR